MDDTELQAPTNTYYTKIAQRVIDKLRTKEINHTAYAFYTLLLELVVRRYYCSHRATKIGKLTITNSDLEAEINMNERTIRRSIHQLAKAKIITVDYNKARRDGSSTWCNRRKITFLISAHHE